MIYTLTLNPAVDYVIYTDRMLEGDTNRSYSEKIYFGGKGINVSLILHELGIETTALGLVGGFTGTALENAIASQGIHTDFVKIEGCTRINVKIKHTAPCSFKDEASEISETEINAAGPCVYKHEIEALFQKLKIVGDGDILIMSGSVPRGENGKLSGLYEYILKSLSERGCSAMCILDTSGDSLLKALKYHPYLIKPNKSELEQSCGKILKTDDDIIDAACKMREMGARNVLVSLGADGAILVDMYGNVYKHDALKGNVLNTVGAGDSMTAGFAAGLAGFPDKKACIKAYVTDINEPQYTSRLKNALRLGIAAGCATAFSEGLASFSDIMEAYKRAAESTARE